MVVCCCLPHGRISPVLLRAVSPPKRRPLPCSHDCAMMSVARDEGEDSDETRSAEAPHVIVVYAADPRSREDDASGKAGNLCPTTPNEGSVIRGLYPSVATTHDQIVARRRIVAYRWCACATPRASLTVDRSNNDDRRRSRGEREKSSLSAHAPHQRNQTTSSHERRGTTEIVRTTQVNARSRSRDVCAVVASV
jgi:hypothetical protein